MIDTVLFNRNDRASFSHVLVEIAPQADCFILVQKGDNMMMKHIGTRGLVGSLKGLEILPDVSQELFRIYVVVVLLLP